MDMIPLNRFYYEDAIKDIDDKYFVVYGNEGLSSNVNVSKNYNPNKNYKGHVYICYNLALPSTWASVFGNEPIEKVIKEWYKNNNTYNGNPGGNAWYSDQNILTEKLNNYNGPKVIRGSGKTKYNRLNRNDAILNDREQLKKNIQDGVYSDYHCSRPYSQYKELNNFIVECLDIYVKNSKKTNVSSENESDCKYIDIYGIQQLCDKLENIYYVKTELINDFTVPSNKFILVSGTSDATVPDDINKDKFNSIIKSPLLIHWFAQNLSDHTYKNLTPVPIGLDYHTLKNGEMNSWGKKQTPLKQEEELINIKNSSKPFHIREQKLYCNFYNSIRGRYGEKERREALNTISNNLLIIEKDNLLRNDTWKNMCKYSFVLSPPGNGLDCHRTWEALVLGCIPVFKTYQLDPLYKDLPVLIVKDYSDITPKLLNDTIEKFKTKKFSMDQLTLKYWMDLIKNKLKNSVNGGSYKKKRKTKKKNRKYR